MYRENVAQRLKKARLENELTQEQVAQKIGIHQSTLAGYEKGRTEPDLETIGKLAQLYFHTVDYFLGLAND